MSLTLHQSSLTRLPEKTFRRSCRTVPHILELPLSVIYTKRVQIYDFVIIIWAKTDIPSFKNQ